MQNEIRNDTIFQPLGIVYPLITAALRMAKHHHLKSKKNNSIGQNKRKGRIFFLKINKHIDPNNCVYVGNKSE